MAEKTTITCISCPMGCEVDLTVEDDKILEMDGARCPAGKKYVKEEYRNPTRILPTTARVKGGVLPLVPVKSDKPLPKERLEEAMTEIAKQELEAPVELGDIVIENIFDTGVNIVTTRDLPAEK